MTTTYLDLINRGAGYYPERTAIVFGGESLTFRETHHLSNQLAHGLIQRGVTRHQRVALLLNNSLYSVPVDFACVKAGINRVPLNARLSLNEHRKMLEETGCAIQLGPVLDIIDIIRPDDDGRIETHYTLIDYAATWIDGEPVAGDDAMHAAFVALADIDKLAMWDETVRVIRAAAALKQG